MVYSESMTVLYNRKIGPFTTKGEELTRRGEINYKDGNADCEYSMLPPVKTSKGQDKIIIYETPIHEQTETRTTHHREIHLTGFEINAAGISLKTKWNWLDKHVPFEVYTDQHPRNRR